MDVIKNKRKCLKCSCSAAEDHVTLYRFPKPGTRNLLRCELWAKYICPEQEPSVALQKKLHNEHRMLCHKHFKDTDFVDLPTKKLFRHAVPSDTGLQIPTVSVSMEGQAGPSRVLVDVINLTYATTLPTAAKQSVECQIQPVTTQCTPIPPAKETIGSNAEKEKKLYAKCLKYMRRTCQMRNRIKNLKKKAILKTILADESVQTLSKILTPSFALLLQSQIRNFKRKITGRRWTRKEKILALRIYKRSPTCYRLLRRMLHLPAPNTLKTLLNTVPYSDHKMLFCNFRPYF